MLQSWKDILQGRRVYKRAECLHTSWCGWQFELNLQKKVLKALTKLRQQSRISFVDKRESLRLKFKPGDVSSVSIQRKASKKETKAESGMTKERGATPQCCRY